MPSPGGQSGQDPEYGGEATSGDREDPVSPVPISAVEPVLEFEASAGNGGGIERRECSEGEKAHEETAD